MCKYIQKIRIIINISKSIRNIFTLIQQLNLHIFSLLVTDKEINYKISINPYDS